MNKNILNHFFPGQNIKPCTFKELDHNVIAYSITTILNDIHIFELFNVCNNPKTKTIFESWKKTYTNVRELDLYNLIKMTAETITHLEEMKTTFLTKQISMHLMLDLEFLKFYLELRGSKTGDVTNLFNSYNTHQKKYDKVEIYLHGVLMSLSILTIGLLNYKDHKDEIDIIMKEYKVLEDNKYQTNYSTMFQFTKKINNLNMSTFPDIVKKKINTVLKFVESITKHSKEEKIIIGSDDECAYDFGYSSQNYEYMPSDGEDREYERIESVSTESSNEDEIEVEFG